MDGVFVNEILRWWEYEIPEDIVHIGNYFDLKHTWQILESIYITTGGKGFANQYELSKWEDEVWRSIDGMIR